MGRKPRTEDEILAIAREAAPAAMRRIARMVDDAGEPGSTQLRASQTVLDRAWGKVARGATREVKLVPWFGRIERVIVGPGYEQASKKPEICWDKRPETGRDGKTPEAPDKPEAAGRETLTQD